MSVFIQKMMTCVDGRDIKEVLGDVARPMEKVSYKHTQEYISGKYEYVFGMVRYNHLAIDLYEIAPHLFDKKKDMEEGFLIHDMNGHFDAEEKYLRFGFKVLKKDETWTTFSHPFYKEVLDTYYQEEVHFGDHNEMWWCGNYHINETVDFAVSYRFPDTEFEVKEIC
jgi:hypothetical protein